MSWCLVDIDRDDRDLVVLNRISMNRSIRNEQASVQNSDCHRIRNSTFKWSATVVLARPNGTTMSSKLFVQYPVEANVSRRVPKAVVIVNIDPWSSVSDATCKHSQAVPSFGCVVMSNARAPSSLY